MAEPRETLIMSIDFGSTGSGVGWGWATKPMPEEIETSQIWRGEDQATIKTPTLLLYKPNPPHPLPTIHWGFGALERFGHGDTLYQFFKMQLPNPMPIAGISTESYDRTVIVELVSTYLKELWQYTVCTTLESTIPTAMMQELGKSIPVEVYLTFPAVWNDRGKSLLREAAITAGLHKIGNYGGSTDVRLLLEPVAAAGYCFDILNELDLQWLNVGDTFVVADCGGASVDAITYELKRKTPSLFFQECVPPTGSTSCGSVSLHNNMMELLEGILPQRVRRRHRDKIDEYLRVFGVFDSMKKKFHPGASSHQSVSFVMPPSGQIVPISDETMTQMVFLPVFRLVAELIQDQISKAENRAIKPIGCVFMVGGFGTSTYLQSYLSSKLQTIRGGQVNLLQPRDAQATVIRGAVSYGLRKYRMH